MPECSNMDFNLFADDTALITEDDDIENLILKTNNEFQKVCKYFRLHKLSLHPDKTKFIIISNSKKVDEVRLPIFINNNNLDQNDPSNIHEISRVLATDAVPAIKYLGVYFDTDFSFKYHIQQMSSKISRALFQLRRVKHLLSQKALRTLYFSLVHCHLTYAIEIWSSAPPSYIKDLFLKQKTAIRIISDAKYNSHTAPLFKKQNILPLDALIKTSQVKVFHHFINNKLPTSFAETWSPNRARYEAAGTVGLRNEDDYHIPFARTNQLQRFPLTTLPKTWNDLPVNLKLITNHNSFASAVKTFYLDSIPDVPVCTRLFCPVCTDE
jgi:hypothetical protein